MIKYALTHIRKDIKYNILYTKKNIFLKYKLYK